MAAARRAWIPSVIALAVALALSGSGRASPAARFLDDNLLVSWYGNPRSARMGILGELSGSTRAEGLRRQAEAYAPLTSKRILPAYHLVAVIAQPTPGRGGLYRRREGGDLIHALLTEARQYGFALILDVQLGRAAIESELAYLEPYLSQPDVHLALDPEFRMIEPAVPGRSIGSLSAAEVNAALDVLDRLAGEHRLPPKVLILHQFTLGMLPDKQRIRQSDHVDLALTMDGFGPRALKLSTYRAIMRQHPLDFAGIKLFYRQDTNLFTPEQVMGLKPLPSVVIYQ